MTDTPEREEPDPTPETGAHQHCADTSHFIRVEHRVMDRHADLGLPDEPVVFDTRWGLS